MLDCVYILSPADVAGNAFGLMCLCVSVPLVLDLSKPIYFLLNFCTINTAHALICFHYNMQSVNLNLQIKLCTGNIKRFWAFDSLLQFKGLIS